MIAWALLAAAWGAEPVTAAIHGDVKAFLFVGVPYDSPFFPDDPYAAGIGDGRFKLSASSGRLAFEFHHAITVRSGLSIGIGPSSGVGAEVPEAVPLSWTAVQAETLSFGGRTDRLWGSVDVGPTRLTLGRQPISFGQGMMFTPLDLVGPFNPAVVDQEYKPGYDALRFDAFWGVSGRATAVVAYGGDWSLDGLIGVAYGQHTFGVTDLGLFLGEILSDEVFGATLATSVGPVGLYGDAALTLSDADGTFFRGTVGALFRPTGTTTLTAEVYTQTLGAKDPSEYLLFAAGDRFARGELWLLGRYYAGLALAQEITPLVNTSVALIGNLGDGSAFLGPSLAWSVASNAEVDLGAFFGLGDRPDDFDVQSEFGLYPITIFLETKAYW